MNKICWNYKKENYKRIIASKEESLQIHIKELDRLRAENKQLRKKLNEATVNEANRKIGLRELTMRSNFAFPENEEDTAWFNDGRTIKFMRKLFVQLGLGDV